MRVPAKAQDLGLGEKKVSDLLGEDVKIRIDGSDVTVTGEIKNLADEWTEFAKKDNTGHFFPVKLPAICKGEKVTVKGRKAGDRTVAITDDLLLIQRLENLSGSVMEIWMKDALLMRIDFSGASLAES